MKTKLAGEIWRRLTAGESVAGLGLPSSDGGTDLRGFAVPAEATCRRNVMPGISASESVNRVCGSTWSGLDFTGASLKSLRFRDCVIENCRFDGALCRDWRLWSTVVRDCTFVSTDLRESALGGVVEGRRNAYLHVNFSGADLRKTVYVSADMVACSFIHSKLAEVDFQGTVFRDCVFVGELRDVLFYRHAFEGEAYPPNEMEGADFRQARFRNVEFRGMDLTDVRWPNDGEHVVIPDYRAALERILVTLADSPDDVSRKLAARIRVKLKWAGLHQASGVVSKEDLRGDGGNESVRRLMELLSR